MGKNLKHFTFELFPYLLSPIFYLPALCAALPTAYELCEPDVALNKARNPPCFAGRSLGSLLLT